VVLNGQPAGEIALANPPGDYTSRDLAAIERLARLYALALQRKITQQQVWAALREKEVLLREIHHRVKNNLQVISSLLSLQTRRLADAKVGEMFKESQNRVRSMAMIHEQLHRSTDLSRIDFAQYLRNLTASLFSSYGVDSSQIGLKLDITEACLPIDLATPFGLIVHELVSNSLKHAFADGREGEIRIAFRPLGDSDGGGRQWRLTVADDGPGLPTEVDPENSSSLGLRLVRILAEQLDGSVEYRRDPGSKFQITLSDQE
jgi:two-component sensor histidine kinase